MAKKSDDNDAARLNGHAALLPEAAVIKFPPPAKGPAPSTETSNHEDTKSPPPVAPWIAPSVRALAIGNYGPRLATEIAALDKATRGGPVLRKLVIIGGAPGAGKTTLAMNLVHLYLLAGYYIGILAADEDADGLLVRLGQLLGFDRTELEAEGETPAKVELAAWLDTIGDRLLLADSDETTDDLPVTVEQVSAELVRRRGSTGRPSILVVDSVQTTEAAGTAGADGPRLRTDAAVKALRRAGKRDGHLVIATSEVNRGNYKSSDKTERVNDLAAFKETGGIEFKADLALVLRNVTGAGDSVDVTIPKNRLRGADLVEGFRLQLDRRHARFTEVAADRDSEDEQTDRNVAAHDALRKKVLRVVRLASMPGRDSLKSDTAVALAAGGRKGTMIPIVKLLRSEGAIVVGDDGAYRLHEGGEHGR